MSKCNCAERISQLEAALNELADKQSAWAIIASDIVHKALTPTNTDTTYRCPDCDAKCHGDTVHYCWVDNTTSANQCIHSKGLSDYCEPCGRIHGG